MTTARPEVSGSFYRYPPPKLLFYLYGKQLTGVLAVREGITQRFLYLRDGVPVHAEIADEVPSIADLCQRFGWADDHDARKQQLVEKIIRLFGLPDAEFSIYRTDHDYGKTPEQAKRLRVHPRRAIHHGIRGAYDRDRVRAEIGTLVAGQRMTIPPTATGSLARYSFDEVEWELVRRLCGGALTIEELAAFGLAEETRCWHLVYSLLATQALTLSAAEAQPEERKVAEPVPVTRARIERPGTYALGGPTLPPRRQTEALSMRGTEEPDEIARKVESLLASFESLDCFELLGVKRDADTETIEKAFQAQRERFDPERLALIGLSRLRDAALQIQAELETAYAAVRDGKRRRAYVHTLTGEARGNPQRARALVRASKLVNAGREAIEKQQWPEAIEVLRQAVDLHAENGEALALLAWATWQKGERNPIVVERIQNQLLRAVQLAPEDPRPFRFLGEVFLVLETWDKAITCFRKALARADGDMEAERGLRLAMMRKDKAPSKRGSLFGRTRAR
jgi:Flp pilus assembly protein TadD